MGGGGGVLVPWVHSSPSWVVFQPGRPELTSNPQGWQRDLLATTEMCTGVLLSLSVSLGCVGFLGLGMCLIGGVYCELRVCLSCMCLI